MFGFLKNLFGKKKAESAPSDDVVMKLLRDFQKLSVQKSPPNRGRFWPGQQSILNSNNAHKRRHSNDISDDPMTYGAIGGMLSGGGSDDCGGGSSGGSDDFRESFHEPLLPAALRRKGPQLKL